MLNKFYTLNQEDIDEISSQYSASEITFFQKGYEAARNRNEAPNINISYADKFVIINETIKYAEEAQKNLVEVETAPGVITKVLQSNGMILMDMDEKKVHAILEKGLKERFCALDGLEDELNNSALIIRPDYESVEKEVKSNKSEYVYKAYEPVMSYETGYMALKNSNNQLLKRSTSTKSLPLGGIYNIKQTLDVKMQHHRFIVDVSNVMLFLTMLCGALDWSVIGMFFFVVYAILFMVFEQFPMGRKIREKAIDSIVSMAISASVLCGIFYMMFMFFSHIGIALMVVSGSWLLFRTWRQMSVFKEE